MCLIQRVCHGNSVTWAGLRFATCPFPSWELSHILPCQEAKRVVRRGEALSSAGFLAVPLSHHK